jgi:hypothetical protein
LQAAKLLKFIERSWQFIIKIAKLCLLLQTGSHITQEFSSARLVINEISDTAFV